MVEGIHAKGLTAGWYLNGCKCGERKEIALNYQGDVHSLDKFGFDGVKIDGCGAQRNQTYYAELMMKTGRNYTIENCHWGRCTDSDDSSCPTQTWCPFNWYRTSGDINAGFDSWFQNLQTTVKFQDYNAPLSVPGCWAYPDMLEVGRVTEPAPGRFYSWNRAHFGAWAIISAPLILGLELTDEKLNPILDIITNPRAIAVNQAWAGHPGMLVENVHAKPVPYNPSGVILPSTSPADFGLGGGASITGGRADNETSGHSSIRTGGPGQISRIQIGSGFVGNGHRLDHIRLHLRVSAGYTPPAGQAKRAPTVRLLLVDVDTSKEVRELCKTGELGNYSWDHFTTYSPPIVLEASGLDQENHAALAVVLEVTNNERNLQIPVDDLTDGWAVHISWAGPEPERAQVAVSPIAGQVWAKPLPKGAMALLFINHSPDELTHSVSLSALNLTAPSYTATDVWEGDGFGPLSGNMTIVVPPWDSAFWRLEPQTSTVV